MATLTKDELESLRVEHVAEQNKRYSSVMKSIVEEAVQSIELDLLRKQFIESIKTKPHQSSVSCFYTMKLDKLFGSPYSWRATKDGKGEFVDNPRPPYEVWLDTTRGIMGSSSGKMKRYIFDRNEINHKIDDAFLYYFYNEDPDIQKLKGVFLKAFPDATLILFLYDNCNDDARLHIEIKIDLDKKIPGLILSA